MCNSLIKKYFLLILIIVFFSNMVFSQNAVYKWPLKIFNGLSGTFQEYRTGHFHAGFDLKTFQKTGYPVLAVSDGYINKIRMVKRGSGRGLYLKHSDGRTSIYFHLERFEQKLENILKSIQKLKGKKYIGNYFPKKKIYYKKGEVIGFSGETGSGYPHLHLEIRDHNYRAIDSFSFFRYPGNDKKLPVIKTAILKPVGRSIIDGKTGNKFFKFSSNEQGNYVVRKPVIVTGPFDIILNAYDHNDSGHRVSPYNIIASIDDGPYYEIKNDSFERSDNNQLGLMFDLKYSSSSYYYYNLFYQEGFKLEKRKTFLKDVFEGLQNGCHNLKIKVIDYFGNLSVGNIPFIKLDEPVIKVKSIIIDKNSLLIKIDKFECIDSDKIKLRLLDDRFNVLFQGNLDPKKIIKDNDLRLDAINKLVKFVEFRVFKKGLMFYNKKFSINSEEWPGNRDIMFDTYINREYIYIKIKNKKITSDNISLKVLQGGRENEIEVCFNAEGVYFTFKPLGKETKISLNFSLKKNGIIYSKISKNIMVIPLINGEDQLFKYDEFEGEFAVKSVREPRLLIVNKVSYRSNFPLLSQQYDLSPYNFPFLDKVTYKIRKKVDKPFQVGIFKYNHFRKRWGSVYSKYNKTENTFSRIVRSSGTFALMRDIFPPKIKFYRPGKRYKNSIKHLNLRLTDRGKGINDNTIRVKLNGSIINDEYDPDWSRLRIKDLRALKKGKNILDVSVMDYARHKKKKQFIFFLK